MKAVLIDIDNCISNDAWRIPHIKWQKHGDERYHEYHTLAPFDKPGNLNIVRRAVQDDFKIFFCTARPVSYNAMTREWLSRVVGVNDSHYNLLMRNRDDHRPSVDVKRQQLGWLFDHYGILRSDIVAAYDDHAGIIEMYASLGIPAFRTAIHDVCAYTNPLEKKDGTTI